MTPLTINMITSMEFGLNVDMLNNNLRVLACEKILILIPLWDHVSEVEQTMI